MKVGISDSFDFSPFFEKKLKLFLKEEFVKQVGMEVPILWVPFQEIKTNEFTGISCIEDFRLSWYSGGSVELLHLSWKPKNMTHYIGKEGKEQDDVEIWMEGLEYHVPILRKHIPDMFRKQFWTGYRFIVEVQGLGMDTLFTIETGKTNFDKIIHLMDESAHQWNESEKGLIHGIFPLPSKGPKLKIRVDTGSAGEPGIKALIQALSDSDLNISKLILSNAS